MPPKEQKKKNKSLYEYITRTLLGEEMTAQEHRKWAKEQPKKELGVHESLDWLGTIPVAGEPADLLNAVLYGLKGKKGDAALSLLATTPVLGTMMPVFRGTPLNLTPKDIVGRKEGLGAVMQGGGEYGGFAKGTDNPYWAALSKAEPSSYPRDIGIQRLSSGHFGRDRALWEVQTTVDAIRKHAAGMRGFDPGDYPHFGVEQLLYTDAYNRPVKRMGSKLHTVFERGLPLSEVKRIKVYEDVRFPRDPRQYYDYTENFLEPILGKSRDVTDWIKRYARDTQR